MTAFILVIILCCLFYVIMILIFIRGWDKIPFYNKNKNLGGLFVSVIVPARNEQKNLRHLLDDLHSQDFPAELYEVLMIDDHSDDCTPDIMKEYSDKNNNYVYLSLGNNMYGKKEAIKKAVFKAHGDLILSTDADCRIPENWISVFVSYYQEEKPKLIVGPVILEYSKNIFSKMQALEFLSLIGSGAGAIGAGFPIMCNGANLGFEKNLYLNEMKNEKVVSFASGDDILFMLNIKKKYKDKIKFIKAEKTIVSTSSKIHLKDFIYQRKRWTSKSRAYNDRDIIIVALIVLIINVLLLVCLTGLVFSTSFILIYISLFIIKSIPDFIFLYKICQFFKCKHLLNFFLLLQLIYPFYITFTALYGNTGMFIWKKRKLK